MALGGESPGEGCSVARSHSHDDTDRSPSPPCGTFGRKGPSRGVASGSALRRTLRGVHEELPPPGSLLQVPPAALSVHLAARFITQTSELSSTRSKTISRPSG